MKDYKRRDLHASHTLEKMILFILFFLFSFFNGKKGTWEPELDSTVQWTWESKDRKGIRFGGLGNKKVRALLLFWRSVRAETKSRVKFCFRRKSCVSLIIWDGYTPRQEPDWVKGGRYELLLCEEGYSTGAGASAASGAPWYPQRCFDLTLYYSLFPNLGCHPQLRLPSPP
jgi:hypothetical protein